MRADTGGTWDIQVNYTAETVAQWKDLIDAYKTASASNLNLWMEVIVPNMTEALFVIVQPPQEIPMPEMSQNELLVITYTMTVVDYKGASTKVAFS